MLPGVDIYVCSDKKEPAAEKGAIQHMTGQSAKEAAK
jgi:hypothetical protein